MDGKLVTFTATEIEALEQIISVGHKWLDGSIPAYPNLILKMGRAFLEAQNGGNPQELYLSEIETWYLREILPTNMKVRGEPIGLAIKKKLYPLMLDFEAEKYSSAAGNRYGFSNIDEPFARKDVILEQEIPRPEATTEDPEGPLVSKGMMDVPPQNMEQNSHGSDETVDEVEPNRDQPDD